MFNQGNRVTTYLRWNSFANASYSIAIAQPDEDGIVNPYAKKYKASEEYAVLKRDLDEILTKAKDIAVTTPPTYAINYAWQVSMSHAHAHTHAHAHIHTHTLS